jgi:hypothetical protein
MLGHGLAEAFPGASQHNPRPQGQALRGFRSSRPLGQAGSLILRQYKRFLGPASAHV